MAPHCRKNTRRIGDKCLELLAKKTRHVNLLSNISTTVVSRRHFFSVAPDWRHVTGTTMAALVTYAALSASGADDPLVADAVAPIFPQIAAMKAGRPTSRKIRAMPAWISPAVRVPGARQGAG